MEYVFEYDILRYYIRKCKIPLIYWFPWKNKYFPLRNLEFCISILFTSKNSTIEIIIFKVPSPLQHFLGVATPFAVAHAVAFVLCDDPVCVCFNLLRLNCWQLVFNCRTSGCVQVLQVVSLIAAYSRRLPPIFYMFHTQMECKYRCGSLCSLSRLPIMRLSCILQTRQTSFWD